MTTAQVDDLLAKLAASADTTGLRSRILNARDDIVHAKAHLDALAADRLTISTMQANYEQQLATIDLPSIRHATERDRAAARQQELRRPLGHLQNGTLLRSPTERWPSRTTLDGLISAWTERRDRARVRLESAVANAEAALAKQPVTTP